MSHKTPFNLSFCPGINTALTEREQTRYEIAAAKSLMIYADSIDMLSMGASRIQPILELMDLPRLDKMRILRRIVDEKVVALPEEEKFANTAREHNLLHSKSLLRGLTKDEDDQLQNLNRAADYVLEGWYEELLNRVDKYEAHKYKLLQKHGAVKYVNAEQDNITAILQFIKTAFGDKKQTSARSLTNQTVNRYFEALIKMVSSNQILCVNRHSGEGMGGIILNPLLFEHGILEGSQFLWLPTPNVEFSYDDVEGIRSLISTQVDIIQLELKSVDTKIRSISTKDLEQEADEVAAVLSNFSAKIIFTTFEIEEILRENKLIVDALAIRKKRKDGGFANSKLGISYGYFHSQITPDIVEQILPSELAEPLLKSDIFLEWQSKGKSLNNMRISLFYSSSEEVSVNKAKRRNK